MKTIQTESEVPATTDISTSYACEVCDFTSTDEDEMIAHEGQKHSNTESKTLDVYRFLKFESEEAFNRWTAWISKEDTLDAKWEGPGWYQDWTEGRSRGCGCGCIDEYRCLKLATHRIASLQKQAKAITNRAERIAQMIGAQP